MEAFRREGALDIAESDDENSVDLLVDMCLKHVVIDGRDYYHRSDHPRSVAWFLASALELINWTDTISSSPQMVRLLIWSLYQRTRDLSYKLLELRVDVHAETKFYKGVCAIRAACYYQVDLDIFMSILEYASAELINKGDADGCLVHFALFVSYNLEDTEHAKNTASKLEAFLKLGVDPNTQCNRGHTEAMEAAKIGFIQGLRLLTSHGAKLHLIDRYGWSALQHAVNSGQVAAVKFLSQETQEPGHWKRLVSFLVGEPKYGDMISPLPSALYSRCALSYLASYTKTSHTLECLKKLSVLGDSNALTPEFVAPLHFAACMDTSDTTRWLIDNGADVNLRCGVEQTSALHIALRIGRLESAILLVKAGAKFSKDSHGVSPERRIHRKIRAKFLAFLRHTQSLDSTGCF
ncbi:Ankyrin repeat protein [Pyrenophora tritici-repentis]|nr:Ankyrin repeat protein [Pyrenophora tritici-repentis]